MSYKNKEDKNKAHKRYREKIKADPIRLKSKQDYMRDYHMARPWRGKYKAYRHFDKVHGFETDLSVGWAYSRIQEDCNYCTGPGGGLDRLDNSLGHTKANTVPCCEKCNNILGDLPYPVKQLLASGLKRAQEKGLLDNWVIPTKRRS